MIRGAVAAALACACAATALSACETTQDTSARLAKRAKGLANQQGLSVGRENPDVRVRTTAVVQDANGIAAVVELQNTGPAQASLPVAIAVGSDPVVTYAATAPLPPVVDARLRVDDRRKAAFDGRGRGAAVESAAHST